MAKRHAAIARFDDHGYPVEHMCKRDGHCMLCDLGVTYSLPAAAMLPRVKTSTLQAALAYFEASEIAPGARECLTREIERRRDG